MNAIAIRTRDHVDASVTIPGSKSCTARALVMAGLANGTSILIEPADCDDTDHMITGLRELGVSVQREPARIGIDSTGLHAPDAPLVLGNSGTAVRFLAAACATVKGDCVIDGSARMRERPIHDLIDALRAWGVDASSPNGCPPVTIQGTGKFGGTARVRGSVSSQFLTGLLMTAPLASEPAVIEVDGDPVSKPYIDMTLSMMAERGISVERDGYRSFAVAPGQRYRPGEYRIEADASGASYFLAAAAIVSGRVRITNLGKDSVQGDARFIEVLQAMGCGVDASETYLEVRQNGPIRGIDIDLNAMPDMAQTLATTALFAKGPTTIRNVANLRVKETDRIHATVTELRKLGAEVEEFDDGLRFTPRPLTGCAIDTYDDHRMAMSFALVGLRVPGVIINDPNCVSKTFPDFFERFDRI